MVAACNAFGRTPDISKWRVRAVGSVSRKVLNAINSTRHFCLIVAVIFARVLAGFAGTRAIDLRQDRWRANNGDNPNGRAAEVVTLSALVRQQRGRAERESRAGPCNAVN